MIRPLVTAALLGLLVGACGSNSDRLEDLIRAAEPSVEDDTVDCIIDELDARGISASDISDAAEGGGTIPRGAQAAFGACIPPSAGGTSPSDQPVDTYGSDPTLDALWDDCAEGDGAACDYLYFRSPIGSDYESFGDTCGRRFESSIELCEETLGGEPAEELES